MDTGRGQTEGMRRDPDSARTQVRNEKKNSGHEDWDGQSADTSGHERGCKIYTGVRAGTAPWPVGTSPSGHENRCDPHKHQLVASSIQSDLSVVFVSCVIDVASRYRSAGHRCAGVRYYDVCEPRARVYLGFRQVGAHCQPYWPRRKSVPLSA